MRRMALTGALVLVLGGGGCRTSETGSVTLDDPAPASPLAAIGARLRACATAKLAPPALSKDEASALEGVYEAFSRSECAGCHYSPRSYGAVGNFTVNPTGGAPEFYKGLALRHKTTRAIAAACFAPGEGLDRITATLTRLRIQSDAGIRYKLPGESQWRESVGGVPFFEAGEETAMREAVLSFLQGGFEVPAQPGEDTHEAVYAWVKSGGRIDLDGHVGILLDVIRGNRLDLPEAPLVWADEG